MEKKFDKNKLLPTEYTVGCVDISFPFSHSNEKCDKFHSLGMCYIDSAKTLLKTENKTYAKDYYILPVLNLLNHGIELSIKYFSMLLSNEIDKNHNITNLFGKIKNLIQKKITDEEFNSIPWDNMLEIIQTLKNGILYGEDNIAYRYPINSKNHELYKYAEMDNTLYINTIYLHEIIEQLEIFFNALTGYIDSILYFK